jgi:glycosyltransferase involved in cell wall biosynthesis
MDRLPISVVILAFNEEKNIAGCLKSVEGWVEDIFIVDSFSTDKTLEIARRYTQNIYQHSFENYGQQRNWALENLPLKTDWILNLDADQRVTAPLKEELFKIFSQGKLNDANGFMIKTKTVFMGKWIRWGGHYPIYRIYLFRKGKGNYETRRYHQHCLVEGKIIRLKRDIVDVICPDLTTMIERLNKWSTEEQTR